MDELEEWVPESNELPEWTPDLAEAQEWQPNQDQLSSFGNNLADTMHGGSEFRGPWTESPGMSAIYGATNKFDKLFHGILQPLLESGYLGERVKQGSKKVAQENENLINRSRDINPFATGLGEVAGEAGLMAPAFAAGGAGILGKLLSGAAFGAGKGAGNYIHDEDEESRLMNSLMGAGTGALETGLPAIGAKALNYAKHIPGALQTEKLIEKLFKAKKNVGDISSTGFKNWRKEFGDVLTKTSKFNEKQPYPGATKAATKRLNKWAQNPTTENAHDAYKIVGEQIRSIGSKGKLASETEKETLRYAKRVKSDIERKMENALTKAGKTEGYSMFKGLNKYHRENVLPYEHKLFGDYLKGDLTKSDLLKSLGTNKKFRARLGEKHPEVGVRRTLPYVAGGLGLTGGGYLGFPTALKYLGGNK